MSEKHVISTMDDLSRLAMSLSEDEAANLAMDITNMIIVSAASGAVMRSMEQGIPKGTVMPRFEWINDGKNNITVKVVAPVEVEDGK